ncbi:MAG: hypothetical protein WA160_02300 [Pseudobdellovibrio sp.]
MNNAEIFSQTELKVIELLGSEKITISSLTKSFFSNSTNPIDPNAVISSAVLRINRKCKFHKLDWIIEGTGSGCNGRTLWKS